MSEPVGMVQNTYNGILPIRLAFAHLMPAIQDWILKTEFNGHDSSRPIFARKMNEGTEENIEIYPYDSRCSVCQPKIITFLVLQT